MYVKILICAKDECVQSICSKYTGYFVKSWSLFNAESSFHVNCTVETAKRSWYKHIVFLCNVFYVTCL